MVLSTAGGGFLLGTEREFLGFLKVGEGGNLQLCICKHSPLHLTGLTGNMQASFTCHDLVWWGFTENEIQFLSAYCIVATPLTSQHPLSISHILSTVPPIVSDFIKSIFTLLAMYDLIIVTHSILDFTTTISLTRHLLTASPTAFTLSLTTTPLPTWDVRILPIIHDLTAVTSQTLQMPVGDLKTSPPAVYKLLASPLHFSDTHFRFAVLILSYVTHLMLQCIYIHFYNTLVWRRVTLHFYQLGCTTVITFACIY